MAVVCKPDFYDKPYYIRRIYPSVEIQENSKKTMVRKELIQTSIYNFTCLGQVVLLKLSKIVKTVIFSSVISQKQRCAYRIEYYNFILIRTNHLKVMLYDLSVNTNLIIHFKSLVIVVWLKLLKVIYIYIIFWV